MRANVNEDSSDLHKILPLLKYSSNISAYKRDATVSLDGQL